jgi:hypothetical protein
MSNEPGQAPETDAEPNAPGEEPSPGSSEPSGADAAPVRKRRKKKKKLEEPAPEPEVFERPPLDGKGRERPRFLLRFPEDPELEPLIAAFEAGNYAQVRALAPALAERAERPEVRRAAEELLRRIEPDPLMKALLAMAVALLTVVAAYAYLSK